MENSIKYITVEDWIKDGKPTTKLSETLTNRVRILYNCSHCGKQNNQYPSRIKRKLKDKTQLFCSISCSSKYKSENKLLPAQQEGWADKLQNWKKETKFCSVDNCNEVHYGKSFCVSHYRKHYAETHGDIKKAQDKLYRENNKEKLKEKTSTPEYKKKRLKWHQDWRKNNPEYYKIKTKEYIDKKKKDPQWIEERNKKQQEYRKGNKQYLAKCQDRRRERQKTDVQYRMVINVRNRMSAGIKRLTGSTNKRGKSTTKSLCCTWNELKLYLENKFYHNVETGEVMSWSNYGYSNGDGTYRTYINAWHVDHVKPLTAFDLTDPKQFDEACHYTNLQPMWAKENLKKGGVKNKRT